MQSGGETGVGLLELFEGPNPRRDAAVQLRHRDLQRQIEGGQPHRTGLPGRSGLGAAQDLKDRYAELFPEGRPQASLRGLDRSKGGGADHGVHRFPLQEIQHTPLHRRVPQAADPQRPRG